MDDSEHSKLNYELLIRLDEQVKALARTLETMRVEVIADNKSLRADVDSLKMWRWICVGGLTIITVIVVPLVVYIWNSYANIQKNVSLGVQSALSVWEKE